ncbi:MAG: 3'-5' exonuclease [Lautropia sp.]|nr:3'-5' exonuclease [Lautropia sp.]
MMARARSKAMTGNHPGRTGPRTGRVGRAGASGGSSSGRLAARRQASSRPPASKPLPSKEAVQALPPFERLADEAIVMVTPSQAHAVAAEIATHPVVGFDTESKPVFVRGQVQEGPHLVQFAVADRAWLFSMGDEQSVAAVAGLMQQAGLRKVGFGLAADRALLARRLGAAPVSMIDLDSVYRQLGYRHSTGIRMAVAITFGRYFEKSKTIGKSDWSRQPLSVPQRRYAAHDAWGAFRVYQALVAQQVEIRP